MVERVSEWLPRGAQIGEVDEPSHLVVEGTSDSHDHAKAMAMNAMALVTGRNVRQAVRALESEFLFNLHPLGVGVHGAHI